MFCLEAPGLPWLHARLPNQETSFVLAAVPLLGGPLPMGNLSQEWIQHLHYLESWQEVECIPGGSDPETLMTILPKKGGPGAET